MKTLALLSALLLLASSVCAHADNASCKPITDADIKLVNTSYHEVSTLEGNALEKIYTTTTLSMRVNNGKWMTMPMTPRKVLGAMRESGGSYSGCKVLRTEIVDGQPATVYAAHRTSPGTSVPNQDDQIWITDNGLTLKTVSDVQMRGHTMHAEAHITYDRAHATAGAH